METILKNILGRAQGWGQELLHFLKRVLKKAPLPVGSPNRFQRWRAAALSRGQMLSDMFMDPFFRMKIRIKLSVLVGFSIAIVTFVIITSAVGIQERELRVQTQVVGTNLVQSLNAVARDNLLLESIPAIQDYVNNYASKRLPGLEHLAVMDRSGKIVAHLLSDQINQSVTAEEWDLVTAADSALAIESETHFVFFQGVYVRKDDRKILLGGVSASFSKAVLLSSIDEMKQKVFLTSFIVSVIAISFVYVFSKRIVHVIIVLSDAARRVGEGDLKVTVMTKTKDELGSLAREFNMMVAQIREKTEMQKFVSKSTMQMLSEQKQATLGGTRRVITAMFTDIRNFTSVAESKWPEEVVVTLNHYLDFQTKLIHEYGGVVDKFIGDGIMSIFTGKDMVVKSVEAAVAIQRRIVHMNKERAAEGEIVLDVGVGIATGVAVMGSIGSEDRMDYTAIGDTVNLSSRLCSTAGPREILVSETVISRLNGKFSTRSAGKIPIKGKTDKVSVFQIPYTVD